jgi:hypothetical protein
MKKSVLIFILISITSILISCNTFEGIADKNSDEAKRIDLMDDLNKGNYDSVINELENKSSLDREEKMILSKAYLGKGGVDFIKALRAVGDFPDDPYNVFVAMLDATSISERDLTLRKNNYDKVYNTLNFINNKINISPKIEFNSIFNCEMEDKDFILISTIAAAVDSVLTAAYIIDTVTNDNNNDDNTPNEPIEGNDSIDNGTIKPIEHMIELSKDKIREKIEIFLNEKNWDKEEFTNKLIEKIRTELDIDRLKMLISLILCGGIVLENNDDFIKLKAQFDEFVEQITNENGELTEQSFANYITDILGNM